MASLSATFRYCNTLTPEILGGAFARLRHSTKNSRRDTACRSTARARWVRSLSSRLPPKAAEAEGSRAEHWNFLPFDGHGLAVRLRNLHRPNRSLPLRRGTADASVPRRITASAAPYTPGGPTSGIFCAGNTTVELRSGEDGPAADMPPQSLGFDGVTKLHVEGHAAALMWQQGISDATLYINNPEICVSCASLLPRMLPPGATLNVVLPDGTMQRFMGGKR